MLSGELCLTLPPSASPLGVASLCVGFFASFLPCSHTFRRNSTGGNRGGGGLVSVTIRGVDLKWSFQMRDGGGPKRRMYMDKRGEGEVVPLHVAINDDLGDDVDVSCVGRSFMGCYAGVFWVCGLFVSRWCCGCEACAWNERL